MGTGHGCVDEELDEYLCGSDIEAQRYLLKGCSRAFLIFRSASNYRRVLRGSTTRFVSRWKETRFIGIPHGSAKRADATFRHFPTPDTSSHKVSHGFEIKNEN